MGAEANTMMYSVETTACANGMNIEQYPYGAVPA